MRTLAIDLGDRRVGFALSDEGGRYATPLEVTPADSAMSEAASIIAREGVTRVVVGLPLNMDGTVGPRARAAVDWGRRLAAQSRVDVVFVDERLSSFAAEQTLVDRKRAGEKLTRKRKKEQLDAVAAAAFLQEFLDGKLPAIEV